MKIIVDTSTIIKGFFTTKYQEPKFIVNNIVNGNFQLAMTDEMAKELTITVYTIAEKYKKNPKPFLRNITSFIYHAEKVPKHTNFQSCADPKDNMFIECAIDGGNKHVISSDQHILNIKKYIQNEYEAKLIKDINFYNPQQFYKQFNKVGVKTK